MVGEKVYIASVFNNNEMQLFYQGNMSLPVRCRKQIVGKDKYSD